MNVKPAFIFMLITAAIFGLLFIIVPAWSLSLFAVSLPTEGIYITRLFGAALLGYGVIGYMAMNANPSEARRGIMLGEIFHGGIATIVFIVAMIQGIGNLLLIIPLLVHLITALWFGYLYSKGAK